MAFSVQHLEIPETAFEFTAVRAQGPGGQHVNKVSSAVQLKFDIHASTLPEDLKQRLSEIRDKRISKKGIVRIVAQSSRSQSLNKEEALARFRHLLEKALKSRKPRKKSRPSKAAREKRLEEKRQRGVLKSLRKKVEF